MNKEELLKWVEEQREKAEMMEKASYRTELASWVYQKVYDTIEFYLED